MDLSVKATDDLILYAGSVSEQDDWYKITPPKQSMFNQLTDWLLGQPDPEVGFDHWVLGIGATALCLRWGTYLSVLMDETKPVDPRAKDHSVSMISEQEMKRINIEASSNLSRLLKMMHDDELKALDLIRRAYEALPMPQKRVKRDSEVHQWIIVTMMAAHVSKVPITADLADIIIENPYRSLANVIINYSYRNGPIENIHHSSGSRFAFRLHHRRFTEHQTKDVMQVTSEHFSGILDAIPFWGADLPHVPAWPQRLSALPKFPSYPSNWSITDESSPISFKKRWAK